MHTTHQPSPYPLRMPLALKESVKSLSTDSKRSINSELILLIEDGIKWRNLNEPKTA